MVTPCSQNDAEANVVIFMLFSAILALLSSIVFHTLSFHSSDLFLSPMLLFSDTRSAHGRSNCCIAKSNSSHATCCLFQRGGSTENHLVAGSIFHN